MLLLRPFADLIAIEQTLHTEGKDDHLMLVELMGLTRDRVLDFVEKRVGKERQEVVKQAFLKNSILMSVSAITFFCAALCRIIGRENQDTPKLTTYTQITAYIIQVKQCMTHVQNIRHIGPNHKVFHDQVLLQC